jgi:DNA-binding NtrC family response regulator
METSRILIVDDHAAARGSMRDALRMAGYRVDDLSSASEALRLMQQESFDVVITDLNMPGMNGLEFIQELKSRPHGAQIIMVTAYATVASAVEAMRHGAFDYLEKPFDVDQLEQLVTRAIGRGQALDAGPALSSAASPALIGESVAMKSLRQQIAQIAPTGETVLISGESGTGKELVARAIHAGSPRASRPMVSLNCPVLSTQLTESELFGHEKGAFTGAESRRMGRFELADESTLLLDEITEIDLPLQAKLLRVLQERCFERVGGSQSIEVDVRVLATTNRNLRDEVTHGRFRGDLYFRLNVLPITLPPLRQRTGDIPLLAKHFLALSARRLAKPLAQLNPEALDLLTRYAWPGNVRELENVVTRGSVLAPDGIISAELLWPWICQPGESAETTPTFDATGSSSLDDMERRLIEETLERFDGHRAKTAQALGIGIRTLSGKLKQYGYAPRAKPISRAA